MPRRNTIELTTDEIIERHCSKAFRPAMDETPPIPASYAGKYVCAVLVAVDSELTEDEMDSLEMAIEALNGVHQAFVLVGPARVPIDRQPADTDLTIRVEAGFEIRPTPEL